MIEKAKNHEDYRQSHASPGYGKVYRETYEHGYYHYQWEFLERDLLERVLSADGIRDAIDALDFACGTGRITQIVESRIPNVTGIDISETMLDEARRICSKAKFVRQDLTAEPMSQAFDLITAFRFFLNAEPELRRSVLEELHRCLRPNGNLVLNIHVNSSSPLGLAYRLRNFFKGRVVAKTCSLDEMREFLHDAGFRVESVTWYSYLPRVGWRMPWLSRYLMRPVEKIANVVPFFPKRIAQSFLIVARKTN